MRRFNNTYVLTAEEFENQGTRAGAILSIAELQRDKDVRAHLESAAAEVAATNGQPLRIPGRVTELRDAKRRSANDNRRSDRRRAA